MEGGGIVESQISASSVHYGILGLQRWGPELARLNNQGIVNAWTSAAHDRNPWIEVRQANRSKRRSHLWSCESDRSWFVHHRSTCRRRCAWLASSRRAPAAWARPSTSRPSRWPAASMDTRTSHTGWTASGGTRLERPYVNTQLLCWQCLQPVIWFSWFSCKSVRCRFSWATQTMTAQRPTCSTLPSLPSTSASSPSSAAGPAHCVWSWWAVNSTVKTKGQTQHSKVLSKYSIKSWQPDAVFHLPQKSEFRSS